MAGRLTLSVDKLSGWDILVVVRKSCDWGNTVSLSLVFMTNLLFPLRAVGMGGFYFTRRQHELRNLQIRARCQDVSRLYRLGAA